MAVLSDAQREAGWTVVKLGDIATVVTGQTPSKKFPEHWGEKGEIPFLTPKDQAIGIRSVDTERYISREYSDIYEKRIVPEGVVALTCIGSSLGKISVTRHVTLTNQQINSIVSDDSKANNLYIYYYLLCSYDSLESLAGGTVMPIVNKSSLEGMEIPLPPLKEQERIAGILGSLDDKIEANTRLIQTLLDTADSIFQKFYSECELSESTYASLEVYGGGTPSTKNETYWGGDIHWLTPTDVTSLGSPILFDTARKLTEDGLNACSSKLHPAGSIMMTSRATIGAFAINQYPAATNQGFIVAVPQREEERWWIYHHMKKDVPEMINSANGTTFLEISRRTFKGLPYGSLSDENLDRFHTVVNPLYELVKSSEQENLQLAETRDALIKRLIG
ncbi:restriction endonuclease subunit S [Rothia mucilaginosa]